MAMGILGMASSQRERLVCPETIVRWTDVDETIALPLADTHQVVSFRRRSMVQEGQ